MTDSLLPLLAERLTYAFTHATEVPCTRCWVGVGVPCQGEKSCVVRVELVLESRREQW